LIGRRCKCGNAFSRPVLIGRGLGYTSTIVVDVRVRCGVLERPLATLDNRIVFVPVRRYERNRFSVAMAVGSHPFPF
jgi:hypothetical protein